MDDIKLIIYSQILVTMTLPFDVEIVLVGAINSITTSLKDENHDKRRKRFLYRIGHIEQSIQSLEAARQKLPAEQVLLARNMSRMQDQIDELDTEIERVTSHVGNDLLSSHLLHGAKQVRDYVFMLTCMYFLGD